MLQGILNHLLDLIDRIVPDPVTMPLPLLIGIYVVGLSACAALAVMTVRSMVQDSRRHLARIAELPSVQQERDREHRERAHHLKLVASRMHDDNEAA